MSYNFGIIAHCAEKQPIPLITQAVTNVLHILTVGMTADHHVLSLN